MQTKLWPTNCRLLDPGEAANALGFDGEHAVLVLGFESGEVPQGEHMRQVIAIARNCGGVVEVSMAEACRAGALFGSGSETHTPAACGPDPQFHDSSRAWFGGGSCLGGRCQNSGKPSSTPRCGRPQDRGHIPISAPFSPAFWSTLVAAPVWGQVASSAGSSSFNSNCCRIQVRPA